VAFGLFGAGVLLAAAGLAERFGGRPGGPGVGGRRRVAATVAVAGLVAVAVDGAPSWGSDVGGVLALVPGFAVLGWRLTGVRLSWSRAALAAIGAVAVVGVLGVIDYARPPTQQTHLGRFVGEILHGGAWTVVRRKGSADLNLLTHSALTLLVPVLVLAAIVVVRRRSRVAVLKPALVAVLVLVIIGAIVNDSGVAIPALAVLVVLPATVCVLLAG
jgi:hypothetical protein